MVAESLPTEVEAVPLRGILRIAFHWAEPADGRLDLPALGVGVMSVGNREPHWDAIVHTSLSFLPKLDDQGKVADVLLSEASLGGRKLITTPWRVRTCSCGNTSPSGPIRSTCHTAGSIKSRKEVIERWAVAASWPTRATKFDRRKDPEETASHCHQVDVIPDMGPKIATGAAAGTVARVLRGCPGRQEAHSGRLRRLSGVSRSASVLMYLFPC